MNAHVPESRLIDLSAGLLGPDEAQATIEHIRHCAQCEQRFRVVVSDREALRAGPLPGLVDGRIQLTPPARGRRIWARVGVVAAVLGAVTFGVLQLTDRDDVAGYWIPVTSEKTILRNQSDSQSVMAYALRSYQARDAAAAVRELQSLKPAPGDVTAFTLRDLYLASALVNAGRPQEGLELLERLNIDFLPAPWRYEAQWVKFVGLRRAGREEEAMSWLEKLAQEPGEIGERARAEMQRHR